MRGCAAALLALLALPLQAQTPPPADPATATEAGRKLYVLSCQRCHGIDLVSCGIGTDLRQFPQAEKERFVRSVLQGVRAMPAWSVTMKPDQVELIWAYVGRVNGWP